jgi:hypothetical protein
MKPLKKPSLSDAPLAITSDGRLVINVTHLDGMARVITTAEKLVPEGSQLFVGVVVPEALKGKLVKELNDVTADVAGRVDVKLTEASPAGPRTRVRRRAPR